MIQSKSFVSWPVCALLAFTISSCHDEQGPCPGVVKGAEVRLEVLGTTGISTGADVCSVNWGFPVGAVIEGTIVSTASRDQCKAGVLDSTGTGGDFAWDLEDGSGLVGGYTIDTQYLFTNGSCEAAVMVRLMGSIDDPFCDLDTGEHCLLEVQITRTSGTTSKTCPEGCYMYLNVDASQK